MQNQIDPDFIKSFWEPRFPGQVPSQLVAPEILEGDTLYLEGEELKVVELGHTDTANSTALYVPSIGLVASGDAVYNNTHPYLAECDEKARGEWLRALDKIEALHAKAVACLIPIALLATSGRLALISATSSRSWRAHRPLWIFTRKCWRCIRTGLIQVRSGQPQTL
jgi:glyoxylase-like metal-dependent hydrolase (beta-lactamase superfamily II)